jgi:hypothetical protein
VWYLITGTTLLYFYIFSFLWLYYSFSLLQTQSSPLHGIFQKYKRSIKVKYIRQLEKVCEWGAECFVSSDVSSS